MPKVFFYLFLLASLGGFIIPGLLHTKVKASTQIIREETVNANILSASNLTIGPVQGGENQLYILLIADHKDKPVINVSGLNLTWTKIAHQCSASSTNGMTIYQAYGSPNGAGNVIATLASTSNAIAATVIRFSGADPNNLTSDAHGENTFGANGNCTGGTDNASPQITLTSVNSNSLILTAVNIRGKTMNVTDADYTKDAEIQFGTSGYITHFLVYDRNSFGPGTDVFNNTTSGATDWVVTGVVINPAAASTTPTPSPDVTPSPTQNATPTPTSAATPSNTPSPTFSPTQTPAGSVTIVGAGDIAGCSTTGDEQTATLVDNILGTVYTLGDNVYDNGTITEFNNCYTPSWGRFKLRTMPVAGNHEYNTTDASGYFDYFGNAAGDRSKGYYSYDVGSWHAIVLNSNCSNVGGCNKGSPQEIWLKNDLATHPSECTLAMWHHPLFSSGAKTTKTKDLFQDLYDYNADLVLVGHAHVYERFAPQTPNGLLDNIRGIRQIIVGTGGIGHGSRSVAAPNSEAYNGRTFGVLKVALNTNSYDWQFIPVPGSTFTDSGTTLCH